MTVFDTVVLLLKKGKSKTTPKASNNFEAKLKYSRMDGRGCIVSDANPKKNLNPYGNTIKYPKNEPPTKNSVDRKTMGNINRFSLLYKPGATNIQNS